MRDSAERFTGKRPAIPPGTAATEEQDRMDVFYLGLTIGFVALSWGLIVVCERLS
jgi:hypothetical protein